MTKATNCAAGHIRPAKHGATLGGKENKDGIVIMDSSIMSTAKGSYERLWPVAVISLGVVLSFGWVAILVWLLLSFLGV
jgi:hypothetical protein